MESGKFAGVEPLFIKQYITWCRCSLSAHHGQLMGRPSVSRTSRSGLAACHPKEGLVSDETPLTNMLFSGWHTNKRCRTLGVARSLNTGWQDLRPPMRPVNMAQADRSRRAGKAVRMCKTRRTCPRAACPADLATPTPLSKWLPKFVSMLRIV